MTSGGDRTADAAAAVRLANRQDGAPVSGHRFRAGSAPLAETRPSRGRPCRPPRPYPRLFFNDAASAEISPLARHGALPICESTVRCACQRAPIPGRVRRVSRNTALTGAALPPPPPLPAAAVLSR